MKSVSFNLIQAVRLLQHTLLLLLILTSYIHASVCNSYASHNELNKVIKCTIILMGAAAMIIALYVGSVYTLWYLASDLVYCVLFPQLTVALVLQKCKLLWIACQIRHGSIPSSWM